MVPQNINDFKQITFLKTRILLLGSENRLLKDDIAEKDRLIGILLNFNKSKIQSHHNKNNSLKCTRSSYENCSYNSKKNVPKSNGFDLNTVLYNVLLFCYKRIHKICELMKQTE